MNGFEMEDEGECQPDGRFELACERTWEQRAKELAKKAENSSEGFDAHDELVSHNDPQTIALVADCVAVMRQRIKDGNADLDEVETIAALDVHTEKRT